MVNEINPNNPIKPVFNASSVQGPKFEIPQTALRKKTVLLVDDEYMILNLNKIALERSGFGVTTAINGEEGFALFTMSKFDIVISDLRMPKLNGIQLFQMVKVVNPNQPFILCSGTPYDLNDPEINPKNVKVDNFLPKPYRPSELIDLVKKILPEEETTQQ